MQRLLDSELYTINTCNIMFEEKLHKVEYYSFIVVSYKVNEC